MPVSFDTSAVASAANATSISLNITTSGSNIGLMCGAYDNNTGRAFSSFTADAISGTLVAVTAVAGSKRLVVHQFPGRTAGTINVRVAYGGGTDMGLGVASFNGIKTTGMVGSATAGSGSAITHSIVADINGMGIQFCLASAAAAAINPGAAQTERWDTATGTSFGFESSTIPGSSTIAMSVSAGTSTMGVVTAALTATASVAPGTIIPQFTVLGVGP